MSPRRLCPAWFAGLVCATLLTSGAGSLGSAAALVGNATVGGASDQTVMLLNRSGRTAGFCTAVVLAPQVVLTAAHCVTRDPSDMRIDVPGGTTPTLLAVAAAALHPDYRPDAIRTRQRSVDLALVRLSAPLPVGFRPATLAQARGTTLGARFLVEGYGVAREGDGATSGTLRHAILAARAPLSDLLLWAADPVGAGSGACTGDSGGPVRLETSDEVVAITLWSAGDRGALCGALTQALWVAPHRDWIRSVLSRWGAEVR